MSVKVYYFTEDGGDGSSSVCFTTDPNLLGILAEDDPETYGMNEGQSYFTVPDDFHFANNGIDLMFMEY